MPIRLSDYLKAEYGEKIYRLSLASGCTCPNRDGSILYDETADEYYLGEPGARGIPVTGGCLFCSEGGSGEFAEAVAPIDEQIERAKERIRQKTDASRFIAYFQSFTNTYGDVERLKKLYMDTIKRDEIAVLSIGTRPDCLGPEVMEMLKDLNAIKPVWVELGLQTIHEDTAKLINRGYKLRTFTEAYKRLKAAGITVIVHVILGLPGESREDMLDTVRFLSELTPPLDGIKLQNLQILKGTRLYELYKDKLGTDLHIMDMEEYTDLVAQCIALLPKDTVVHRMTGDGPRWLLVEPLWTLDKKRVLNTLTKKTKSIFEGC